MSRFHCIEPPGDGSINCHHYSYQSLIDKRPPDVYPHYSDDTVSELFSEKVSEGDEKEEFCVENCPYGASSNQVLL